MSSDPYTPDSKPAPPSRAYRSAPAKKQVIGTPPPTRIRPPMPAPPIPVLLAEANPAADANPDEKPLSVSEAEAVPAAAPEPYSPYRVPPPRQLPEMVFQTPGSSEEARNNKRRSALSILWPMLGVVGGLVILVIGFGVLSRVTGGNQLQGELTSSAQVGQCYTDQVRFIDCSGGHTYEVFAINQLPQRSDYPGVFNRSLGSEACEFRFFDYVGIERTASSLGVYSVYPSEPQWAEGERWEICVLADASLNQLVGSATASIS